TYSFDFSTEDLSLGALHGRYRYTFQVITHLPNHEIKTDTIITHDDLSGVDGTYSHLVYSEPKPWMEMSVDLFELDQLGRSVKNIKHEAFTNSSESSQFPETLPFAKEPLITLWKRGEVNAQEITDTQSGHKLLFNFEAKALTYVGVRTGENGSYFATHLYGPASDLVNARVKIIDTSASGGKDYEMALFANDGPGNSFESCQESGETRELPTLLLGDSTPLHEVQYCYPLKNSPRGFQRLALPVHKIGNDPSTKDALNVVLEHGGKKAANPTIKLNSSELGEVNCHGYSLLSTLGKARLGLPEGATWIEGGIFRPFRTSDGIDQFIASSVGVSQGTYPLQAILDEHYKQVFSFIPDELEPAQLRKNMSDSHLKAGDIAVLVNGDQYTHSGVIVRIPSKKEFWVESKIAEGPIVQTPLQNLLNAYNAKKIEIYRLK
ncbi:MAG: hypothetical protein ACXVBE_13255, partial [Bdellovibrionota bacterium]